jgi:hypothetical protein
VKATAEAFIGVAGGLAWQNAMLPQKKRLKIDPPLKPRTSVTPHD